MAMACATHHVPPKTLQSMFMHTNAAWKRAAGVFRGRGSLFMTSVCDFWYAFTLSPRPLKNPETMPRLLVSSNATTTTTKLLQCRVRRPFSQKFLFLFLLLFLVVLFLKQISKINICRKCFAYQIIWPNNLQGSWGKKSGEFVVATAAKQIVNKWFYFPIVFFSFF